MVGACGPASRAIWSGVLLSRIAHWTCYPRWILRHSRAYCVWEPCRVPHAYLVSGDVTPASERLPMELVAYARASEYQLLTLRGLTLLARLQALQGRLKQAAATYGEVVQLVKRPEELQVLIASTTYYFGLGDLLREWNELEAAEQHLVRGMDLIKGMQAIDVDKLWLGYAALARLQQAQGKDDQALATLDAFMQLAQQRHVATLLLAQGAALRAQLELAQGDLPAAYHWAASSGLSTGDVPWYPDEQAYLTLARVRIAEERVSPTGDGLSDVLFLLEQLLAKAELSKRWHSVLEILLLLALAWEEQGDSTAVLTMLGRALVLAEPEGYVRLFLDEGPALLALLRQAAGVWRHGLAPRYVAGLLEAAGEWAGPEVRFHGKNHPGITPFGYCLLFFWSATLSQRCQRDTPSSSEYTGKKEQYF